LTGQYDFTHKDVAPGNPAVYKRDDVSLDSADICIIFAQNRAGESDRDTDLRSCFILFSLRQINPDVHCIIELYNQNQTEFALNDLGADEIIPKNSIDSDLIYNSLLIPGISSMIYQIYNREGYVLEELRLSDLGLVEGTLYKEARMACVKRQLTLLGFIRGKKHWLSPAGDTEGIGDDRLVVIGAVD